MIRAFNQYISPKSVFLMLYEALVVITCLVLAARIRFWSDPSDFDAFTVLPQFGFQVLVNVIIFQICFYYNELYTLQVLQSRSDMFLRVWQSLGATCVLLGLLYGLVPAILIGRGVFFISVVLLIPAITLSRAALDYAWNASGAIRNVLILGTGELAATVGRELGLRADLNTRLAGFASLVPNDGSTFLGHPVLGIIEELNDIIEEHHIRMIVVAMEDQRGTIPVRSLVNIRVRGIPVHDAHTILANLTGRIWLHTLRPSWFVYSEGFQRSKMTIVLKRIVDLCFGTIGLILTAPVMALVAVLVRLGSPGPIIYRQTRVGWRGRSFEVLKFRSMRTDAESSGPRWAQQNDPRVTSLGRFLRKYRLDELPQFINVIRGDMSFVGPRPERPIFVEQLCKDLVYYDERHTVRPGITGWAQVEYPYGASVEDSYRKLEYDLFYLKNMSVLFDFVILFQTVRIVLFGTGAR